MVEVLIAVVAVVIAIVVPFGIEVTRRPELVVDTGRLVNDERWLIAHVRVRNLSLAERGPLARFLGRWLTARAADGCSVSLAISGGPVPPMKFPGKWSSRHEPIAEHLVPAPSSDPKRIMLQIIGRWSPQKLPGIHHVSIQPGPDGDSVAVAIRPPGEPGYAYAIDIYEAERFPRAPHRVLPPGRYRVEAQARTGELTADRVFDLVISEHTDSLCLSETTPDG